MKAKLFVTTLALLTMISSCTTKGKQNISDADNEGERIKLKEYKVIQGTEFYLLEVDSVEYLFQYHGGAVRLGKTK